MTIAEIQEMEQTAAAARESIRIEAHRVIDEKLVELAELGFRYSLQFAAETEAPAPLRQRRCCSLCRKHGHYKRNCPQKLESAATAVTLSDPGVCGLLLEEIHRQSGEAA